MSDAEFVKLAQMHLYRAHAVLTLLLALYPLLATGTVDDPLRTFIKVGPVVFPSDFYFAVYTAELCKGTVRQMRYVVFVAYLLFAALALAHDLQALERLSNEAMRRLKARKFALEGALGLLLQPCVEAVAAEGVLAGAALLGAFEYVRTYDADEEVV